MHRENAERELNKKPKSKVIKPSKILTILQSKQCCKKKIPKYGKQFFVATKAPMQHMILNPETSELKELVDFARKNREEKRKREEAGVMSERDRSADE